MNRGVAIIRYNALRNQDRVLVVVAVPRHKRDQHVLTECEFADIGRCAIGNHVATRDDIANFDQRTLVDIGVLV